QQERQTVWDSATRQIYFARGREGGDVRLERDGILVFIDPRFERAHAGRSGIVMARTEEEARHELAELRSLAMWAFANRIVTADQIRLGQLGILLRTWLNTRNTETISKKQIQFREAMKKAHASGRKAEKA